MLPIYYILRLLLFAYSYTITYITVTINTMIYISVYALELFDPFISALVACCHQQSIVLLGMTREFSKPIFFKKLSLYFTYTLVPYNNTICSSDTGDSNSSCEYSNIGLFICQLLPQGMRS